jgi:hypothetical protein
MPGKIKSIAQQRYLAVHDPAVLHELSGGHIAKGLPYHVSGRIENKPRDGLINKMLSNRKGK